MPKVELIYDGDCPNIGKAQEQLKRAFAALNLSPKWTEWDRANPDCPPHAKPYASPTILVDERDVAGGEGIDGSCGCRVYVDESGAFQGVPSLEQITSAIKSATPARTGWRKVLPVVPALGAALLPALGCPACWPAYAGLLGALGVGFVNYTPWLLPLTVVFLAIALGSFAYRAKQRRGYGPLALGGLRSSLCSPESSASNLIPCSMAGWCFSLSHPSGMRFRYWAKAYSRVTPPRNSVRTTFALSVSVERSRTDMSLPVILNGLRMLQGGSMNESA